jgi:hypothetical protein
VTYPVFIVTAQGGGIYAAYNAAVFLSRMEDLCPDFHNHVFAISSVSGGSIGAAAFAAALDAGGASPPAKQLDSDPCPRITTFLSNAHPEDTLDDVGAYEQKAEAAMSADFLSPLIAAALFPDFSQLMLPHPVGVFDRARALEYTLEDATDRMYRQQAGGEKTNILKTAFQDYWKPEGAIPALLINATDSGSGKRIVISPFDFEGDMSPSSAACRLVAPGSLKRFAISTAAFISARFPWVSPAASTDIINNCMAKTDDDRQKPTTKIRLVDGGNK